MSYIVPSELPKSCSECPYGYLIMKNPLSSKTHIERYRCQVGKPPWRTFDVDFYNEEYKHKDCPLVPIQEIVENFEEILSGIIFEKFTQECNESYMDGLISGYAQAIEIVKEVGIKE